jgi:hypothetical protein
VDPLDDVGRSWHWLWYAKERWAADGLTEIYRLTQKGPKDNGLSNIWAYARGKLTDKELFVSFRAETADLYVGNLLGAGVIAKDFRTDAAYLQMTEETAMEGIKACRPLVGCVPEFPVPEELCPVALAAGATWLHFIDLFHAWVHLPRVWDLRDTMMLPSQEEKDMVEANDFTVFALTDKERVDLKKDLQLTVARMR